MITIIRIIKKANERGAEDTFCSFLLVSFFIIQIFSNSYLFFLFGVALLLIQRNPLICIISIVFMSSIQKAEDENL